MNRLKSLLTKYNNWAETWSKSQLVFLMVVVFCLGGAAIWTVTRLAQAQEVINNLLNQ